MLEKLFNPQSIAVVGVSTNTDKLATVIYNNIAISGYVGELYPVNPKYTEINGQKCFAKVSDIGKAVDTVVIVVPAGVVPDVVADCGASGTANVVIISAGFAEVGPAGMQLQEQVLATAKQYNLRVLGPNCLGVIVPGVHLNASFALQMPHDGNIAFLSQSGAFNTAMLDKAQETGLGFSHFISLGNKSDLNEMDFLQNWLSDPKVQVIGMYLEEFSDGNNLLEIIHNNPRKPIVILHPGETQAAQTAISSHTGSLAGSAEVIRTALRQAGVIQVNTIEDLFNIMMMLSWGKLPAGNRVAVITNAGGPGIMLTDMLVKAEMQMPEVSQAGQAKLAAVLPATAAKHNPVDLVGDALADRYVSGLEVIAQETEFDTILVVLTPQYVTQIEDTARALAAFMENNKTKTVIPLFLGGKYVLAGLERLWDGRICAFNAAEEAVAALAYISKYQQFLTTNAQVQPVAAANAQPQFMQDVLNATTDQPAALDQVLAEKIAREVGLDMPREQVITTMAEAAAFATQTGYPLVLKATTSEVVHKTDTKALYLNIISEAELTTAFQELTSAMAKLTGQQVPPVLIQEQIKGGLELIVGANRDGSSEVYQPAGRGFGHLILVGMGGIYTEIYHDVSTGLVPLSRAEITQMIDMTKVAQIIHGARGQTPLAVEKLIDTILSLQNMVMLYPQIKSLDINPVMLTTDRSVVVDLKVFVQK